MATDGGQHLSGGPVLEDLRLRKLGAENERVETRLVDQRCCRDHISILGICFQHNLLLVLLINVNYDRLACVAVP